MSLQIASPSQPVSAAVSQKSPASRRQPPQHHVSHQVVSSTPDYVEIEFPNKGTTSSIRRETIVHQNYNPTLVSNLSSVFNSTPASNPTPTSDLSPALNSPVNSPNLNGGKGGKNPKSKINTSNVLEKKPIISTETAWTASNMLELALRMFSAVSSSIPVAGALGGIVNSLLVIMGQIKQTSANTLGLTQLAALIERLTPIVTEMGDNPDKGPTFFRILQQELVRQCRGPTAR
ncbi:hypothetical protein B0H12DRAFT_1243567 [Mycena haematopus]|nr:hypothetical protein B0H12DRAFT_1243567 [Mycena haematopus]